jgi:hypothetical protein
MKGQVIKAQVKREMSVLRQDQTLSPTHLIDSLGADQHFLKPNIYSFWKGIVYSIGVQTREVLFHPTAAGKTEEAAGGPIDPLEVTLR